MNTFTNYQSNPKHFQWPLEVLSKLERSQTDAMKIEDFEILHSNAITSALQFVEDPNKVNLNGVIQFLKALDSSHCVSDRMEKGMQTVHHLMLILKELSLKDQTILLKHLTAMIDDTEMYLFVMFYLNQITDYWWYKWQS